MEQTIHILMITKGDICERKKEKPTEVSDTEVKINLTALRRQKPRQVVSAQGQSGLLSKFQANQSYI